MATTDFLPSREPELVTWINTFKTLITASPTSYGLTAGQATSYGTLATNFVNAYNVANADATRSPSSIVAKDDAKVAVIANTRMLARIVQATPAVTPQQKSDLGLTVRDTEPTPIPPPAFAPGITIVSSVGNTVKLRLTDTQNPTRRGKPAGVDGAAVYSFVGATPPDEEAEWTFEGLTSRTKFDINFPPGTAAGSQVWFTAFWFNDKKQNGPAANRVTINLPGGGAMAA